MMIQDGRRYLVHCTWKSSVASIEPYWEIVRWGKPCGLSDPSGKPGWITNNGFSLRMDNCTFGECHELAEALTALYMIKG
jgi:hypothetical protein